MYITGLNNLRFLNVAFLDIKIKFNIFVLFKDTNSLNKTGIINCLLNIKRSKKRGILFGKCPNFHYIT